jgi:outer membrane protein OmpA-like peptidoglycan-associated protein
MTSMKSLVTLSRRGGLTGVALAGVAIGSLVGCSTMKDLSPFGSDVPYSQDVKPRMSQPANPEVPAFTPAPQPQKPAPAPPSGVPSGPQSSLAPPAREKLAAASDIALVDDLAALDGVGDAGDADADAPAPVPAGRPGHPVTMQPGQQAEIPLKDRSFKDEGTYPNLAQVPARPPNMPTFLEAAAEKKAMLADRDAAKAPRPESPAIPSPDSSPEPEAPAAAPPPPAPAIIAARTEDRSPCLSPAPVTGEPTAVLRFAPGSAALNSDDLAILADAIPTVRGSTGPIRLFGHGDTATAESEQARFDLAAARAGAVARALAGYGIQGQRIAIGVACVDASVAGASVQLYTES